VQPLFFFRDELWDGGENSKVAFCEAAKGYFYAFEAYGESQVILGNLLPASP
jgi:hypothetical protein